MVQFIIYQGAHFTIEWYFNQDGSSSVKDYFEALSFDRKRKFYYLIRRMADCGKIQDTTKFRYEGDHIYAFKPQPDRYLCFFIKGSKIIITNAFEKKCDKLPLQEKRKALAYEKDYIQRTSKKTYYR